MTTKFLKPSNRSLLRKKYKPGMPARVLSGLSAVVAACALAFFLLVMASAVSAQSTLITLHTFSGTRAHDGAYSYAPLMQDGVANLYGTTASGGTFNNRTVFRVDASGN